MVLPRALSFGGHLAMVLQLLFLQLLLVTMPVSATHACEAEVASACPDRPGSETAGCLKDPSEHEKKTTISSECTDFIALNVACKEDLGKFCEGAIFSDDTVLCLTKWTDQQNLSPKCTGVLKWAVPQEEEDSSDAPTDELGLSAKDYAEKREWQANRRSERSAAIEKMRSEKTDAAEAAELETLKKENPEEYKQRLKEIQEAKRSFDDLKKRKRLLEAAAERQRRKDAGLPETDEVDPKASKKSTEKKTKRVIKKNLSTWETIATHEYFYPGIFGLLGLLVFGSAILNSLTGSKDDDDKDD